jgi:hypothetical protein
MTQPEKNFLPKVCHTGHQCGIEICIIIAYLKPESWRQGEGANGQGMGQYGRLEPVARNILLKSPYVAAGKISNERKQPNVRKP